MGKPKFKNEPKRVAIKEICRGDITLYQLKAIFNPYHEAAHLRAFKALEDFTYGCKHFERGNDEKCELLKHDSLNLICSTETALCKWVMLVRDADNYLVRRLRSYKGAYVTTIETELIGEQGEGPVVVEVPDIIPIYEDILRKAGNQSWSGNGIPEVWEIYFTKVIESQLASHIAKVLSCGSCVYFQHLESWCSRRGKKLRGLQLNCIVHQPFVTVDTPVRPPEVEFPLERFFDLIEEALELEVSRLSPGNAAYGRYRRYQELVRLGRLLWGYDIGDDRKNVARKLGVTVKQINRDLERLGDLICYYRRKNPALEALWQEHAEQDRQIRESNLVEEPSRTTRRYEPK